MPFDIGRCARGELVPDQDKKSACGWRLSDQIDYLQTKLYMNERYMKSFKEKAEATLAKKSQTYRDVVNHAKELRKQTKYLFEPDGKIITDALKTNNLLKMALKHTSCPHAIWFMEQVLFKHGRTYDNYVQKRTQLERKYESLRQEIERQVIRMKRDLRLTEQPVINRLLEEQYELQLAKLKNATIIFIFEQYAQIKKVAINDLNSLNEKLDWLQNDMEVQLRDLREFEEQYRIALTNKIDSKRELSTFESEIYQKAYNLEKELNELQFEYDSLKKTRIELTHVTTIMSVIQMDTENFSVSNNSVRQEEILPMYEAIFTELKEVLENKDIDNMEGRLMNQIIMTQRFREDRLKLSERFRALIRERNQLQRRYFEGEDVIDWKITRNVMDISAFEKSIGEEHCNGYKVQQKLDRKAALVIMTELSIKNIIYALEALQKVFKDRYEDTDESENPSLVSRQEMVDECKKKLSVLLEELQRIKTFSAVSYRTFVDVKLSHVDMDNLKVPMVGGADFAPDLRNRMQYGLESEDEEDALTNRKVKEKSAQDLEAGIRKKKATGGLF